MKKLLVFLSCAALFGTLSPSLAHADQFQFQITGTVAPGSGIITAIPNGTPGQYLIQSMTGTITPPGSSVAVPITGLLAVGTYPGTVAPNDNILYFPPVNTQTPQIAPASYLDVQGTSFTVQGQPYDFNLYYGVDFGAPGGSNTYVYNLATGPEGLYNYVLDGFTVTDLSTTAATPEPESLVLLGTGALGLVGVLRRRFSLTA